MKPTPLHGYADRLSVAPGETIEFKVSSEVGGRFRADLVRLIHGDTHPDGPGYKELRVPSDVDGEYPARFQSIDPGSFVFVIDPTGTLLPKGSFTLHAFLQPTAPGRGEQGILGRYAEDTRRGYALVLSEGRPALRLSGHGQDALVTSSAPLQAGLWYSVAAVFDAGHGSVTLYHKPVVNAVNSLLSPAVVDPQPVITAAHTEATVADAETPFIIAGLAAHPDVTDVHAHFNGKIDSPKLWARTLSRAELNALGRGSLPPAEELLARWDFADGIGAHGVPTDRVADHGPNGMHGICVNMPARAVTGWNWTGLEENFRHAPEQYGAIHFHDDDLDDCGWHTDVRFTVPADLKSDVYALRLQQGDAEDHIPFFVLPPRGAATARILFLVPTASYLAYANFRIIFEGQASQAILGGARTLGAEDLHLAAHPELGLSTYDLHNDGSGVCYSSARRPILNLRPKLTAGMAWQFPADLHLVDWLNASGFEYDIATDLELEQEGVGLLARYPVVLTGTHPEYYSTRMLDAWESYLGNGGRCLYLGSNGFYWVIGWHPNKPWLIETRKAESGSRAWQARPGEYFLATNGERSGIWRNRARAPQKLFGVGFTAEGFDRCGSYRQLADAADPRAAFIMAGIDPAERIGEFGLVGGGAAGFELDRYDRALGTPPQSLLLATSAGTHSDDYPHVAEEIFFNFPGLGGTQDFQVRADIVYFTTRNGGAVFTPGSIAWCGSLSHNAYDNNVSRMMRNVLTRFAADEPLPDLS